MRWYLLAGVLVLLVACTQEPVVCSEPYIDVGGRCCLDADVDGACDTQQQEEGLDCSLCPPMFVTEKQDVIVHKYVCMNGSIMDAQDQCEAKIVSNAREYDISKESHPLMTEFDSRPACRGKFKAAEVHLVPVRPATKMRIQVLKDPDSSFEELFTLNSSKLILDDEYVYIGFCEGSDCESVTDANLPADTAYVIRGDLTIDGERVFTQERLVDPTPEGKYSQQGC